MPPFNNPASADSRHFYIDGGWTAPDGAGRMDVLNPATEEKLTEISLGEPSDINRAVCAAKRAYPTYSKSTQQERIELLETIYSVYDMRSEDIAYVIMNELGAPISLARDGQAMLGAAHLRSCISSLKDLETKSSLKSGDIILLEPVGVCGLITPWNWPINQIALKVFSGIAVGCCVILKPSELTPLNAMLFAEILDEAGCPKGVFNLVNGEGPIAGAALSKHPDVDMISFTGSNRGGTAIYKDAAETVKRLALELGGKSPNLIFADCNIEAAVRRGIENCFLNSGQTCDAPTRMIVEKTAYKKAISIAKAVGESIVTGAPDIEGAHLGPVVSQQQFDRIQELIRIGIDEGAKVLVGGPGKPKGTNKGYFVRPTIFYDVHPNMRIAREEIFGPVLSIIKSADEDDAINIANDTEYGLSAYVETDDVTKAMRLASRLQAGQVNINGAACDYASPFGGYKRSGIGREGGVYGLEEFLEVKAISRPHN